MSDTPIIGVCAALEPARWGFWHQRAAIVPGTYLDKIDAAGGVAVGLLPGAGAAGSVDLLADRIDALMLLGGVDVAPESYGNRPTMRTEATEPLRDSFEIDLVRAAMARDLPILGVCRGLQVINVATGGTLHQHLPDAGYGNHRRSPGRLDSTTFHEVDVVPGSHAATMAGSGRQVVNSHHHQGVARLGSGAVVTARSVPDGLPEAVEWPDRRYVLGVQWHPEATEIDHALDDFVDHASRIPGGRP